MRVQRALIWILASLAVGSALVVLLSPREIDLPESSAMVDRPPLLADLVSSASAIVVAAYQQAESAGTAVLLSAVPTPTGSVTNYTPPPPLTTGLVETELVVSAIIKNDGTLTVGQSITYGAHGTFPVAQEDVELDAQSEWPIVWEEGTEFVLFLDEGSQTGEYGVPFGPCGQILTVSTDNLISCSDAARTVLPFMSGLSKAAFISTIESELTQPSGTATWIPTPTP